MSEYISNIWKYYLMKILGSIEFVMAVFVLFMFANNISMTQIMILESIFVIIILVLEVPSGAFADIYSRKLAIILSGLFSSAGFFIFAIGHTFTVFLIANALVSIGWAFYSGANNALIYDSLYAHNKQAEYSRINGRAEFLGMMTFAFSGILSGVLAQFFDYRTLFLGTATSILLGAFVSMTFKEPPCKRKITKKNYINHMKKALKFTSSHDKVRMLIIFGAVTMAIGDLAWFVVQPYYSTESLPELRIGIVMFGYFFFAALGYAYSHRVTAYLPKKLALYLMLAIPAVCLFALSFIEKIFGLLFVAVMKFTGGVKEIFIDNEINGYTDSSHRATVLSVMSMSKNALYAVLAPMLGYLIDIFSAEAAFLLMGTTMTIYLFVFHFMDRTTASSL